MHNQDKEHLIGCEECRKKLFFEMPKTIVNICKQGKLIIFAGAGISTEGRNVFPLTLYEEIKEELNISEDINFPLLMSKYVDTTHDRRALLNKIKNRIDYAKSFPELYSKTTNFHQELSTVHQIQEIITTNWDDFFELECAATSIVTNDDFVFWDQPFRKVFKIHGSINNPGSIIATNEDYKKHYKELNRGVVGSRLKHLLATRTIVFLGYSLRDYDFNRIYQYLQKNMGMILPHSYFVTLNESPKIGLKNFSSTIIKTDATYFISVLKQNLIEEKQLLPDQIYDDAFKDLIKIKDVHFKFAKRNFKKDPSVIFCLSYQDGLIHALERMLENKNTGQYSHICYVTSAIEGYFKSRKKFLAKKRYFDVAYIDGYLAGLFRIIPDLRKKVKLPMYYVFGADSIYKYNDYLKIAKEAGSIHKNAYQWAKNEAKKYQKDIVLHHTTFLMGVAPDEI